MPDEKQTKAGWHSRGKIAYSPQIHSVDDVPFGGWDEWLIFDELVDLGTSHLAENIFEVPQDRGVHVFVNYGFALHPPARSSLAAMFWQQMARIRPESYVADNNYLTFVTANKALFVNVLEAVKTLG